MTVRGPEPLVKVRCGCGDERFITGRVNRENAVKGYTPDCPTCRRVRNVEATEDALWFWLEKYGASRNGLTARQHIGRHGIPAGLTSLLAAIRPDTV